MTKETHAQPYNLITGCDGGNTKTKLSYLNDAGEAVDLLIPTVVADAPSSSIQMKGAPSSKMSPTQALHVEIKSEALPQDATRGFFYVGEYAYARDGMKQPKGEEKHDSSLHLIVTLVSLAVAAAELERDEVRVHYAGGLPIDEFKKQGQNLLKQLKGEHIITFIDGKHSGRTVSIDIYDGMILTEGVSSLMGLMFSIEKGDIVETELERQLSSSQAHIVADLGAETLDLAYYNNGSLDKHTSRSIDLGTNKYIDSLIHKVSTMPDFDPIRRDGDARITHAREDFVNRFIIPSMDQILRKGKNPHFSANWAYVKNVDITDIVLETMQSYSKDVRDALLDYWGNHAMSAEEIHLVGGGALFGYKYLSEMEGFNFLPQRLLNESPFVTARSYLINNFLTLAENPVEA